MGTSFILDKFPYLRQGSSPRVWGQDYPINLHLLITRIIPTRMGTSNTGTPWHADDWDHPHAYGDKHYLLRISVSELGSSPRVWGQAFVLAFT